MAKSTKAEKKPSLARKPGARGPSMRAVVEDRLAWVERKMLEGIPDSHIDREGAKRFGLERGQLYRYRRHVLRRWPSFESEEQRGAYFKAIIARSTASRLRCVRNERIARKAGDIAAANGAIRTATNIDDKQMAWIGLAAPKRVEITKAAAVNPFHLRARIKAELEAGRVNGGSVPLADRKTEGSA